MDKKKTVRKKVVKKELTVEEKQNKCIEILGDGFVLCIVDNDGGIHSSFRVYDISKFSYISQIIQAKLHAVIRSGTEVVE